MAKKETSDIYVNQRAVSNSVLVTLTSSLFWAYLILCALHTNSTEDQPIFSIPFSLKIFCGLISFTLVQYLLRRAPGVYKREKLTPVIILSFVCAISLLLVMLFLPFDLKSFDFVSSLAWFLSGISAGLFFPVLGSAWSMVGQLLNSRKSSPKLVCLVFPGIAFFIMVALLVPVAYQPMLLVLYFVFAYVFFFLLLSGIPDIKEKGSEPFLDKFNPMYSPKKTTPLIVCATITIAVGYSIPTLGLTETLAISAIASFLAGMLMFVEMYFTKRPLFAAYSERFFFPVASLCFLLLAVLPIVYITIPLFILMAMFVLYLITHWSFLVATSLRFEFSSPYHFSLGLIKPAEGMVIGWAVFSLFVFLGSQYIAIEALFFACVVFYVAVVSIAPYASDPTFEIDILDPDITESMDDHKKGLWKKKCELICVEASLSLREREIFDLLARGRNAEYIQTKLNISRNTVNTHKYRIYRKLKVESHQEILDLVEQRQIPESKNAQGS